MSKLIYLVALFLLCLNLVSCGNPTTLVVTKKRCYDAKKDRLTYTIGAKLDIRNEGSQVLGEQKASKQGQEKKYYNYRTKNKKFGIYTSMAYNDLTYTSNGRSQFLDKPVRIDNCSTPGGCFCNATTYYGYI